MELDDILAEIDAKRRDFETADMGLQMAWFRLRQYIKLNNKSIPQDELIDRANRIIQYFDFSVVDDILSDNMSNKGKRIKDYMKRIAQLAVLLCDADK